MSLLQSSARVILKLMRWKLIELPQLPAKAVVIAYPHTSNWDLPLALLALAALPLPARWVGKDTLFRSGLGAIFRGLGGIAVNRRERTGFVQRMAEEFAHRDRFNLLIATEGTRSRQEGWKSGFYHIAMAARVPVLLGVVDCSRREVGLLDAFHLTGDESADMARIAALYAGRTGYRPENASPIRLL